MHHPPPTRAATWIHHELGAAIVREVIAVCVSEALPVLPVKGIVTARILYDDVAERPITDVDIRIRRRDFSAFRRLARRTAWPCLRVARSYSNLVYHFPPLSLDVECAVGPPGVCALTVDDMVLRASELEVVPGLRVLVPEIHDHAVLLTVNAFKDKIVTAGAGALSDLERIAVQPSFQVGVFIGRVVSSRVATLAWIVASWLESTRGSAAWSKIRIAIETRVRPRRAYAALFRNLMKDAARAPMALRILARISADAPLMRAEALLGAVALESEMWLRHLTGTLDRG
jgi:hypothetical protein